MRASSGSPDHAIAQIARGQHGVVSRAQLLGAGFSRDAIRRRLVRGALHREHPGVYRVGHRAPSTEARYMAAVLACGDRAVLSGMAAAHLYGLIRGRPPRPEVTTTDNRRVDGVVTHRARRLDPLDATVHRNIRVTTVARTIVDLAANLRSGALARACHEADVRHGTRPADIEAVLARRAGAKGTGKLWRILIGDTPLLLSELEREFRKLLRASGLPLPITNRPAGAHYVDCRWPEQRLTVELDSYRYHRSRHAWEQDRRREREARARGDEFRRYTWTDVMEERAPILADLHALTSAAGGSGSASERSSRSRRRR